LIVPIEIFLPFIALAFVMALISFLPRTKNYALLMISGSMITFWALITDIIILSKIPDTSITSGAITTYTFKDNTFEFTQWPKIFFALIGSIMMLMGGLAWKDEEKPKALF